MPLKTAADIQAGDLVEFGSLTWVAWEVADDEGEVMVTWGNETVSWLHPDERVTILKRPRESA